MTILTWKRTKNLKIKFQLSWLSHPRLDASGTAFVSVAVVVVVACCMLLLFRGGSRGRVQGVRTPPPTWDDLQFSNTTAKKKNYVVYWCWSRARDECTPSQKNPGSAPVVVFFFLSSRCLYRFNINCCYNELIKGNLQKLWNKVLYYLFTCKAAFEIIGLNLKISVIWQNMNMIKQDNPNIKYTELKDQSMMDFHGLLGLIGMEEINVSFKQL